jgi:predicted unusual protein kinase regulating ubiquinone biosynthesis (AarF/ABC1/UbiB family)
MLKAGRIGVSYVMNRIKTAFSNASSSSSSSVSERATQLRVFTQTLTEYGGILAKVGQMLCYGDPTSSVFSGVRPASHQDTHKAFLAFLAETNPPYRLADDAKQAVFRSGSIGQVYRGVYNGHHVVIKVRYKGLEKQTEEDMKVLQFIARFLYRASGDALSRTVSDIRSTIEAELDFRKETSNHLAFRDMWTRVDAKICIPEVFPELSLENVLVVKEVKDATSFGDFCRTATAADRNTLARQLVRFVFESLYTHKALYSDLHPGNFLITEGPTLNVVDFGCVHRLTQGTRDDLVAVFRALEAKDAGAFLQVAGRLGLILDSTSERSRQYCYLVFKQLYEPWTTRGDFRFSHRWIERMESDRDFSLIREWGVPSGPIMYMNKIPHGLFHLLADLRASSNFSTLFDTLLGRSV